MKETNEMINKIYALWKEYCYKYEGQPNAILINEEEWYLLSKICRLYANYSISDEKNTICEIFGMKIIPIKKGEMRVIELL